METADPIIRVRTRRLVMDWALVLASQNIEASIVRLDDGGWALVVRPEDKPVALAALRQYQIENRNWNWRQPLPVSGLFFHAGSVLWAVAISAVYYFCEVRFPRYEQAGILDSQAIRAGQWWRVFTAISLHENLPHLMANLTAGFLLIGLAMARYGAGVGMLSAYLAGAAGNVAGLMLYPDHQGLGASGMVMGALGLLATESVGSWKRQQHKSDVLWRAGGAAALVLVLIGFSPGTDIVAHVGGFIAGAIVGGTLSLIEPARLQKSKLNIAAGAVTVALALWTWFLSIGNARGT